MTHSDTINDVATITELLEAAGVDVKRTETVEGGHITIHADVDAFDPEDLNRDDDGEIDPTGAGGGTEKGDI